LKFHRAKAGFLFHLQVGKRKRGTQGKKKIGKRGKDKIEEKKTGANIHYIFISI
jgi:hypothetical protein